MKFMELYVSSLISENEIDNFVDEWHTCDRINCELYEFLGMTSDEYNVYVQSPTTGLKEIKRLRLLKLTI